MSQAIVSNHSNVFTFTLLISDGQSWEPNKTVLFFPLRN
jgi:hypothetical protein